MAPLSSSQAIRYARHLTLPEVGQEGQEKLTQAKVLIVGAGGLGSPAALYLAAAGVGTIGLVDYDRVETSNLQRQILYGSQTVGRPKLAAATNRLRDLNPEVTVIPIDARLESANALAILAGFDLTLDGSDNFPTRYLVNDASVLVGKPYLYGSVDRFEGQVSVFAAADGPCYRCLFPEPPAPGSMPNCADAGVLGVLPGVIGTLQAVEAIKLILGIGDPLIGRMLLYHALTARFHDLALRRDPNCVVCGAKPSLTRLIDYHHFCGVPPAEAGEEVSVTELDRLLRSDGPRPAVVDVREPWEWELCRIEGSRNLPLGALSDRLADLDPAVEIVAVCHQGVRAESARRLLVASGFRARKLTGGIDAWAALLDPGMPRY